ncbi:MAG: hypothetical protein VX278_15210 [Myxococcota bacterium]|nr:hypothetical protein [Myxococcota bacterium]
MNLTAYLFLSRLLGCQPTLNEGSILWMQTAEVQTYSIIDRQLQEAGMGNYPNLWIERTGQLTCKSVEEESERRGVLVDAILQRWSEEPSYEHACNEISSYYAMLEDYKIEGFRSYVYFVPEQPDYAPRLGDTAMQISAGSIENNCDAVVWDASACQFITSDCDRGEGSHHRGEGILSVTEIQRDSVQGSFSVDLTGSSTLTLSETFRAERCIFDPTPSMYIAESPSNDDG